MAEAAATINMKVDPDVKRRARDVFEGLGLDMTSAINLFLRQAIRVNGIPFALTNEPVAPRVLDGAALRPRRVDGSPVLPADWDDPEDAVYDELYAD